MLVSALVILPVVFVTTLPTNFVVDQALFQTLQNSTYKVSEVIEVDGKKKTTRTELPFPEEIIESLHALEGRSYSTAREFSMEVEAVIGAESMKQLESIIMTHARTNQLYWIAVLLIALAASGHAAWMANLYAMAADVFPRKGMASVAGIGGMIGALAGILADFGLGQVLTSSGTAGYFIAFLIAGLIYLVLLGIMHILTPGLKPLGDDLKPLPE
jgi:hypothetical protein